MNFNPKKLMKLINFDDSTFFFYFFYLRCGYNVVLTSFKVIFIIINISNVLQSNKKL